MVLSARLCGDCTRDRFHQTAASLSLIPSWGNLVNTESTLCVDSQIWQALQEAGFKLPECFHLPRQRTGSQKRFSAMQGWCSDLFPCRLRPSILLIIRFVSELCRPPLQARSPFVRPPTRRPPALRRGPRSVGRLIVETLIFTGSRDF